MDIFLGLVISVVSAVICVAIANAKGRNPWLWGALGFFFTIVALIVITALPSARPSGHDVDTSEAGGVRHCPQCNAENDRNSFYCAACGTSLRPEPEVQRRVVTSARFLRG